MKSMMQLSASLLAMRGAARKSAGVVLCLATDCSTSRSASSVISLFLAPMSSVFNAVKPLTVGKAMSHWNLRLVDEKNCQWSDFPGPHDEQSVSTSTL